MIKKHQYCFANISVTEARIFMKFYMVVNYYLVILCIKFHSAWCINARARVVNARNRDKMYGNAAKRAHARLQIVCARVCMDHLMILYYLMNISFKFHKDRSFHCGDIRKTILTFKNHQFSMYFTY